MLNATLKYLAVPAGVFVFGIIISYYFLNVPSDDSFAIVLHAGDNDLPIGTTGYLGQGKIFSSPETLAYFIIPFDATVTKIHAYQTNNNEGAKTTYTVKNPYYLDSGWQIRCAIPSTAMSCSNSGNFNVNEGQHILVQVESFCSGLCPPSIQGISVSVELRHR